MALKAISGLFLLNDNITQTCLCNILQFFTAVKMIFSDEFFVYIYFIFLLKT